MRTEQGIRSAAESVRAFGRVVEIGASGWENESGPEGASTPESPGLTPHQLDTTEERSCA